MLKIFTDIAWNDYLYWQQEDRKVLKKINQLVKAIDRNPYVGIGKPEALKFEYQGYWSRRITQEHRLIYKIEDDKLIVFSCKDHY